MSLDQIVTWKHVRLYEILTVFSCLRRCACRSAWFDMSCGAYTCIILIYGPSTEATLPRGVGCETLTEHCLWTTYQLLESGGAAPGCKNNLKGFLVLRWSNFQVNDWSHYCNTPSLTIEGQVPSRPPPSDTPLYLWWPSLETVSGTYLRNEAICFRCSTK